MITSRGSQMLYFAIITLLQYFAFHVNISGKMFNKNKSQIHTVTHIQLPAALLCQLLLECAKCTTKETG